MQRNTPGQPNCHACVVTPPGRGAVATIVISGPDAMQVVSQFFQPVAGKQLDRFPKDRVLLGDWLPGDWASGTSRGPAEQLVVRCGGDDHIEVHCHGGRAAVKRVLTSLGEAGCQSIDPATWLFDREPDRLVAEAHLALAEARTVRVAAILLDQLQGALSREIASIEAVIERGDLIMATKQLDRMLVAARLGTRLTAPWRIVVAGRVNAGKSTLVNAILGYRRSIVNEVPGTTRDVLSADAAIDGWPVEIVDTAGLRTGTEENSPQMVPFSQSGPQGGQVEDAASLPQSPIAPTPIAPTPIALDPNALDDAVESAGIVRAEQQYESADLLLWVVDVTRAWSQLDERVFARFPKTAVLVHNKADLEMPQRTSRPAGIWVSARYGKGITELVESISRHLVSDPPVRLSAVPFLKRHNDLIAEALKCLKGADVTGACVSLKEMRSHSDQ